MDSPGLVVLSTLLTRHLSFHLHFHLSLHLARPPSSSPAHRLVFLILFFFSGGENLDIFFRVRLPWIYLSVTVCVCVLHKRTQTCVSVCFSLCQCVVSLREALSLVNGTSTQVNSDWQLKPKHTPHTHTHASQEKSKIEKLNKFSKMGTT